MHPRPTTRRLARAASQGADQTEPPLESLSLGLVIVAVILAVATLTVLSGPPPDTPPVLLGP